MGEEEKDSRAGQILPNQNSCRRLFDRGLGPAEILFFGRKNLERRGTSTCQKQPARPDELTEDIMDILGITPESAWLV